MKRRNPKRLRLLITDDHATTRLGIRQILAETFPAASFGEAGDAADALRQVHEGPWDLLILDVSLPGRDGLDLLREIHAVRPQLPVLIFSAHPEEQFAVRALKSHAAGYLTKERAPEELAGAVRKILQGGTYLSSTVADRLAATFDAGRPSLPHETLSEREFAVLRLVARGATGKAIAAQLALSPKTVSTYRTRLLTKLRLSSTAGLIEYAMRQRLVL